MIIVFSIIWRLQKKIKVKKVKTMFVLEQTAKLITKVLILKQKESKKAKAN